MRVKIFATLCMAAAVSMIGVATPLSAQTKIGFIDFQTALIATADMQAEAAKLETEFQPRQDELEKLLEDLQSLQQRLSAATDAQQQATLQAQGVSRQREYERKLQDLQADIDFRRDGVLQKGADRMRVVLEKIREDRGLDGVLDTTSLYVFNPALELTVAATAAYDAAHPVAAPAPVN